MFRRRKVKNKTKENLRFELVKMNFLSLYLFILLLMFIVSLKVFSVIKLGTFPYHRIKYTVYFGSN